MSNYIKLKPDKTYGIPLSNGVLRIDVCSDINYPGIDIEFVANKESNEPFTRPRVLIEAPIDINTSKQENLRVLVWGDAKSEDYTDSIVFEDAQLSKTNGIEMVTLSFDDEIGHTEFKVSKSWLDKQNTNDNAQLYNLADENPEESNFVS